MRSRSSASVRMMFWRLLSRWNCLIASSNRLRENVG